MYRWRRYVAAALLAVITGSLRRHTGRRGAASLVRVQPTTSPEPADVHFGRSAA